MRSTFEAQNAILESIVAGASLRAVLTSLCTEVESLHPGVLASVLLRQGEQLSDAAGPSLPTGYRLMLSDLRIGENGGGSCPAAAFRRHRVIVEDIEVDPTWARYREVALHFGLRAAWSTPILSAGGEVLGTFTLYARHPRGPSTLELASVDAFARLAAIAIERARTAAALDAEEQRYRALVDQIPGAVYRVAIGPPWRCSFMSPAIAELSGRPVSDFLEARFPWQTLVYPDDVPRLEAEIREAVAGHGLYSVEYRLRRPDGTVRWVLDRGRVLEPAVGASTEFEGVMLDVTERKKVEDIEAVRQAELPYRLVSLATRDAVYDWDLLTDRITWGEGFTALFGYERIPEVNSGAWWLAHIHPDDRARVDEHFRAVFKAGDDHAEGEYRFRRRDGHDVEVFDRGYIVHDDRGRAVRMVGAMQDITAQKQVRVLEERLRLALSNAELGTWDYDPLNGELHWDVRWRELLGIPAPHRATADLLFSRMHPDDRATARAKMERAMDPAGSGEYDARYRILDEQGRETWVHSKGRAVFDHGRAVRFVGTVRDITDEVRAEEALRDAARRKDEFLAMLGHELRNPLSPILTALELMRARDTASAREQAIIQRQVSHMVRLIDDLLDLSRITRGTIALRRAPLEIHAVITRAVEMAQPLLEERRHQLTLEVPGAGLLVDADAVRLAQVVANLLTNAAKYTEPGGHVTVRAWGDGERVHVAVRDDGIGIPPELLGRIFEPFMQVRKDLARGQGGLGLGLALALNLTRLHGGELVARSEGPGRGSEFTVHLPRAAPAARAAPAPKERAAPARPARRRILVVDDNEDAAFLLGELFEEHGHEVLVAHDGPAALALCEERCPDLAILDIGLPGMDGYELARRLRAQCGEAVRLVALTGYGQETDRQRAEEAGFDRHLVKPVESGVILRSLETVGGPARSEAHAPF